MNRFCAPVDKSGRYRPWLWPVRAFRRLTAPIPPGLWLINFFFQRVLDMNNNCPWMVHFTSVVVGDIEIGRNVWISFAVSGSCYIQGNNGIVIGDDTIFAPGVKMISANHSKCQLNRWDVARPIHIGKRCWIGANASILQGVHLGDDCIVGAGSVVTQSFPEGTIIAGVPAKVL